ncbi:MAG: hypothetical protein QW752_05370, partial [Thermoplasmata archaeon]
MNFKSTLDYGLISVVVLTLLLLVIFVTPINRATIWEIGTLVLVNVVAAGTGILRIHRVTTADPDFKTKIGKAGAEHSWLILSVTTGVLALLFGKAFHVNTAAMVTQYILLSGISIITIFIVVEVAMQKITFL